MNAIPAHLSFELKSAVRNPSQLLMYYLFPLGVYLVLAGIMTQLNPTFRSTLLPAMALLAGMAVFLLGMPGPLVEGRDAGVFRSFRVNGVPAQSMLGIPFVSAIVHYLVATALIVVTAGPLFRAAAPAHWGMFALVTVASAVLYGTFGLLIGVVSSNSRVTMMLTQLIFLPSMLLGGLMVPTSMLPRALQKITFVLPTTHLMQLYSYSAYDQKGLESVTVAWAVVASSAVLAGALAVLLFRWDRQAEARRLPAAAAILAAVPLVVSAVLA
jgi:ABC-2 type transport system permease protein